MTRWLAVLVLGCFAITGCGNMKIESYAGTEPAFKPEEYFLGRTKAWGFFQDRFGTIRREFVVEIDGRMEADLLILDERFRYADGELDNRVWRIRSLGNGAYEGTADDIVGIAKGQAQGRAMNWVYDFDLPVGGSTIRARFDDWMIRQDEEVMLNKTTVSKFGLELGQVFIFFRKLDAAGSSSSSLEGKAATYLAQQAAE
jgi:hypothetical protein